MQLTELSQVMAGKFKKTAKKGVDYFSWREEVLRPFLVQPVPLLSVIRVYTR